jgi:hypothetical protein
MATDTTTSAANPANHGIAWRAPTNSSAPSGDVKAQSATADDAAKPPRLHCRANGRRRLNQSWLRRNRRYRRVRAKV